MLHDLARRRFTVDVAETTDEAIACANLRPPQFVVVSDRRRREARTVAIVDALSERYGFPVLYLDGLPRALGDGAGMSKEWNATAPDQITALRERARMIRQRLDEFTATLWYDKSKAWIGWHYLDLEDVDAVLLNHAAASPDGGRWLTYAQQLVERVEREIDRKRSVMTSYGPRVIVIG